MALENTQQVRDELTESISDLFTSISTMVKNDLQGTRKELEVLEKMNREVEEEYAGFGDMVEGLRVFVEQLKNKSGGGAWCSWIEGIEQVTEFEAIISVLGF